MFVTYHDGIIFESLLERLKNSFLMLSFDYSRRRFEHSKCVLSLLRLRGLTELEECAQEFRPGVVYPMT